MVKRVQQPGSSVYEDRGIERLRVTGFAPILTETELIKVGNTQDADLVISPHTLLFNRL